MSDENVELVQQSFVVWGETGEPAWDLLRDDVEVHDHDIMDAGEYRGRAGVERWLADWESAWAEFSMAPEEFLDAGHRVVAVVLMKATGRSSGVPIERQDAIVYELREGKIARLDYFNSRAQALEAAGLTE